MPREPFVSFVSAGFFDQQLLQESLDSKCHGHGPDRMITEAPANELNM